MTKNSKHFRAISHWQLAQNRLYIYNSRRYESSNLLLACLQWLRWLAINHVFQDYENLEKLYSVKSTDGTEPEKLVHPKCSDSSNGIGTNSLVTVNGKNNATLFRSQQPRKTCWYVDWASPIHITEALWCARWNPSMPLLRRLQKRLLVRPDP